MSYRQPYKSDLSDERWALIEPVIASWKAQHPSVSGHRGAYEMREIVNALLYQSRTGCQWDYLPHDLLRWQVRESRGRFPGRKRGLAVDVLGLVIAVVVLAASAHDNAAGIALLDKVAADTDTVHKALVDQGFKTAVIDHGQKVGIDVEVVERNPATSGFVPQPKRWVVEQVNGIMMPPPPSRGCTGP